MVNKSCNEPTRATAGVQSTPDRVFVDGAWAWSALPSGIHKGCDPSLPLSKTIVAEVRHL